MSKDTSISPQADAQESLVVRDVTVADLRYALSEALNDFKAMPSHAVFLVVIYPIAGALLFGFVFNYDMLQMVFPLVAGFALLGPVAAIGLYELSRRREQGLSIHWTDVVNIVRSPSALPIAALSMVLLAVFALWLATASAIYELYFGAGVPDSLGALLADVIGTAPGRRLLIVGTGVGFLFALVTFAFTVISFPLLLDRRVGAPEAAATSIRVVLANPFTMGLWALIIVALLVIGSLPALVGLAVVLPVLGHASWHLYRRAVA